MGISDPLVLKYPIFCIFDQYSRYAFMNMYNFRTWVHSQVDVYQMNLNV